MGEFMLKQSVNKVWYGIFTSFAALGIRHGISTRLGGHSTAPFHSLNLGLHTGDDAEAVWNNRQLFCQAVGLAPDKVVTAEQIHGVVVEQVTVADAGRGAKHYHEAIKGTDALITNVPGLPLMLFFADCVPVLIVDPVAKAVGISHAGWKGTVGKIAQKTVLAMQQQFNTNPADCLVGIGPSIGPCCYEVDEVVINKLKVNFDNWEELVEPHSNHWRLNLWEANRHQLREIGVPDNTITVCDVCTACNTEIFFSHRAEAGRTGRIGAIIAL
ncbi:Polyphenol oxidase [Sporomusa silvacetica DSM 10669]|uniref:Purine nucleoside phosphorylase n=1 Tax=Sporomusa silvacetica DSM 10669 TaxID=1123289 RepID=A0ABZ3IKY8_9FIRM|nr:peptidoglycan editing factor PgeF [Sporomusa silvacetica]OZC23726.1 laccase domain protein YfiH [Sporomusa silvacetica DSM 10669]